MTDNLKDYNEGKATNYAVLSLKEVESMVDYIKKSSCKENVKNKSATIVLNFCKVSDDGQIWLSKNTEKKLMGKWG